MPQSLKLTRGAPWCIGLQLSVTWWLRHGRDMLT